MERPPLPAPGGDPGSDPIVPPVVPVVPVVSVVPVVPLVPLLSVVASTARQVTRRGSHRPPQGALTEAQRAVTIREEVAFGQLEAELGGRDRLVAALASAHLPKKLDAALGLIADPLHDHESLGQICALAGVTVGQLLDTLRSAAVVKGQILATQRIATALPDVAAAVMEEAIPGIKNCSLCLGARWMPKPTDDNPDAQVECPSCRGIGTVVHAPDHDVQKTALKIGGLLGGPGGGKGINLQVLQQNTQVAPGDSATYDALIGALDKAVYGEGRDRLRGDRGGRSGAARSEDQDAPDAIDGETLE